MGAARKKRNDPTEQIPLNEIPTSGRKFFVKDEIMHSNSKDYHVADGINNDRNTMGEGPTSVNREEMNPSITNEDENSATNKDVDSSQSPDHIMKQDHHPSQKIGCLSVKHSLLLRRVIFGAIALIIATAGNIGTLFVYLRDVVRLPYLRPKLMSKMSMKIRSLVQHFNTSHSNGSGNELNSEQAKIHSSNIGSNAELAQNRKVIISTHY